MMTAQQFIDLYKNKDVRINKATSKYFGITGKVIGYSGSSCVVFFKLNEESYFRSYDPECLLLVSNKVLPLPLPG